MKKILTLCATALAVACMHPAHAQERTAGSSLDTQMTWTALAAQAKAAKDAADAVNSRVNQIAICGSQGKVYAPGAPGANAQGCKAADVDLSAINTAITNLTNNFNTVNNTTNNFVACSNKGMMYAPTTPGRDANGCVGSGGDFKVGSVITSINGSKGYPPNTTLTAASDIFVSASSYGGGGESCPVGGVVNGVSVASDYAIRYASSVAFLVPKGQKWSVTAAGGNCSGRQVNVSVVPLN